MITFGDLIAKKPQYFHAFAVVWIKAAVVTNFSVYTMFLGD